MSSFTRLGAALWNWEPFIRLNSDARILWLALYTSGEAKRNVPGLFHGGLLTMSDASRMPSDTVGNALDVLLDAEMVEYDRQTRVLRLTELPDAGEFPTGGRVIRSWWTKFQSVPRCGVRDAHIPTLRWVIDRWAQESGKPTTQDLEQTWAATFATLPVPPPRKRGIRRFLDSDTSTSVQPSLFDHSTPSVSHLHSIPASAQLRLQPTGRDGRGPAEAGPVDNSDSVHQLNLLAGSGEETHGYPIPHAIPLGSGIGSGSGSCSSGDPERTSLQNAPTPVLVPALAPFTPETLVEALAEGYGRREKATLHQTAQIDLGATILAGVGESVGRADLVAAGKWVASRARSADEMFQELNDPSTPPQERLSRWAAVPGNVRLAVAEAREAQRVAKAKSDALAEHMARLGLSPVGGTDG